MKNLIQREIDQIVRILKEKEYDIRYKAGSITDPHLRQFEMQNAKSLKEIIQKLEN